MPSAGFSAKVATAAAAMAGRHSLRTSSSRRDKARSLPARMSKAPSAPAGTTARRRAASSAKNMPIGSSSAPSSTGAHPVRPPKRCCAISPPAPWHNGRAPKGVKRRCVPIDSQILRKTTDRRDARGIDPTQPLVSRRTRSIHDFGCGPSARPRTYRLHASRCSRRGTAPALPGAFHRLTIVPLTLRVRAHRPSSERP